MSNPKPHWNPIFAGVPLVLTFVTAPATIQYECQNQDTSAVDLTFALLSPRGLMANVEFKTALESDICCCPFGSDIRNPARHNTNVRTETTVRRRKCPFGPDFSFAAHRHRVDRSQQLPSAQLKRNVRFDAFNWLITLVFQRKSRALIEVVFAPDFAILSRSAIGRTVDGFGDQARLIRRAVAV
jgi:hypothetical protein